MSESEVVAPIHSKTVAFAIRNKQDGREVRMTVSVTPEEWDALTADKSGKLLVTFVTQFTWMAMVDLIVPQETPEKP